MCRLLGFVSKSETNIPALGGAKIEEFVTLSGVHKDSWGIALNSAGQSKVTKSAETALSSQGFRDALEETAEGGLLHFRWASPGIEVTQENAHPFTKDGISFIHNGALQPYDALLNSIPADLLATRKGSGDSELFFLFALSKIKKLGFRDGVIETIKILRRDFSYSSINSMFLSDTHLIIVSEHEPDNRPSWTTPEYYELRYRLDDHGCLVASSGWDQSGWKLLPNHTILVVERATMSAELVEI